MRQDGYRLTVVLTVGLILLATLAVLAATGPSWWGAREVINTNDVANDFAPVTQGQLKHMAQQAWQELEESLPQFGGAGADVSNRVSELVPGGDFYPVNLGQLKYVAAPFYDRLMELEYTDQYPWTGAAETNDFAPANIGQVKNVFAFDVTMDTDEDGMPDWWEERHFETLGRDGTGDWDGDGVSDADEWLGGTDPEDPDDPPNVLGAITYSGQQTNVIRVIAVTDSNSWSLAYSTTLTQPGSYQIPSLPSDTYWVKAFRDMEGDGALDAMEARGEYSGNPVLIDGQVTGVDIVLADPDSDGDGLSDYEELLMGGDPMNPHDGVGAFMDARQRIVVHWNMIYATPLVLTNAPGSAADLQDLDNALQALSGKFVRAQ